MNDTTTAATESGRGGRRGIIAKPADTSTSPAMVRVCGAEPICVNRTTAMPPIIDSSAPGNVTRPACSGLRPSTNCRCCDTKKMKPMSPDDRQEVGHD